MFSSNLAGAHFTTLGGKMANQLKMTILDEAGTSIDMACMAPFDAMYHSFQIDGIEPSIDEIRAPMGKHKREHLKMILQAPSVQKKWLENFNQPPIERNLNRIFHDFVRLQMACLKKYSGIIPGTQENVNYFRSQNQIIGGTTGYLGDMMKINRAAAAEQGYSPDLSVCAEGVVAILEGNSYRYITIPEFPGGRPLPYMVFLNMVFGQRGPGHLVHKIGDTCDDVLEGYFAGTWTTGLALTGNELYWGFEEYEKYKDVDPREYVKNIDPATRKRAYEKLADPGANYVAERGQRYADIKPDYIIDGIWDANQTNDHINWRLSQGDIPNSCKPKRKQKTFIFRVDHTGQRILTDRPIPETIRVHF